MSTKVDNTTRASAVTPPVDTPAQPATSRNAAPTRPADVWEASPVGQCVSANNRNACEQSAALERQVRKATLVSKICDTILTGGVIGTFCTVVLGLAAPWFLPCAVLTLTLGLVARAELHDKRRDKEIQLARKQGEVAMAHRFTEQLRPTRVADALLNPSRA